LQKKQLVDNFIYCLSLSSLVFGFYHEKMSGGGAGGGGMI
jgi:hypothetical protein